MVEKTLAQYLKLVMQQKNLKTADVHRASGLSQSYIDRLLKGSKPNLTVETIAVLAKALDVDGFELFAAAYGKTPENKSIDLLALIDTISKMILNPTLAELVQNAAKLESRHQQALLGTAREMVKNNKKNKKNNK
jgi:transcriptional regulator with XRE-family HTH domain